MRESASSGIENYLSKFLKVAQNVFVLQMYFYQNLHPLQLPERVPHLGLIVFSKDWLLHASNPQYWNFSKAQIIYSKLYQSSYTVSNYVSVSVFLCLCLLSFYLFVFLSFCLFVFLYFCLFVSLYFCPPGSPASTTAVLVNIFLFSCCSAPFATLFPKGIVLPKRHIGPRAQLPTFRRKTVGPHSPEPDCPGNDFLGPDCPGPDCMGPICLEPSKKKTFWIMSCKHKK